MGTKWYLFAKFFGQLSAAELMEMCARMGFDGPTALIRDGYWTELSNMKDTLPGYVAEAEKHGLEVRYADTEIDVMSAEADEQYRILAGEGIKRIRLKYVGRDNERDPRSLADIGRRWAEKACELGEKHDVLSVIQIHGWYYPHCATAAWPMVKGLDPRYVGIKMDPGNNQHQEGYEFAAYQVNLLQEYIAAVGAKDAAYLRTGEGGDDKGWERHFMPAFAGRTNFVELYGLLKKVGFSGPNVLMPFYNDTNLPLLTENLQKELDYLKSCWDKA